MSGNISIRYGRSSNSEIEQGAQELLKLFHIEGFVISELANVDEDVATVLIGDDSGGRFSLPFAGRHAVRLGIDGVDQEATLRLAALKGHVQERAFP